MRSREPTQGPSKSKRCARTHAAKIQGKSGRSQCCATGCAAWHLCAQDLESNWRPCEHRQVPIKETQGESEESRRGGEVLAARIVRAIGFEHLEAGSGVAVELTRGSISLGRGEVESVRRSDNDTIVEVTDPLMSQRHARVVADGGTFVLEDLGSRNGTSIGGRAVQRVSLEDGDFFETGRTAWVFRMAPMGAPLHTQLGPTRSYSPRVLALVGQLARLAPTMVSLLLLGETGTGKEVVARDLHLRSGRRGNFVAVNCGGLSESLLESELFGHRRGAFTGALSDRMGHVEAADGGTLFLDEIGEMSASAQVRLLRVLQEGEIVPVGGISPRKVDVRVVAATHRDLLRMVDEGAFREDLYARLEGWVVTLPRLAERREDLGELVAHAVRAAGVTRAHATPKAARALLAFDWPFNIRQLMKAMEAAIALAQGGPIDLGHLPLRVREGAARPGNARSAQALATTDHALDAADRELRERIVAALLAHQGNVTHAAHALGKQRQQLQRWMRRFGLRVEDYGGTG